MFRRLIMALRAFFGRFIRGLEDPETMLQQYMDDLRAQVPKLNDNVAEVMKMEILQRQRVEQLTKEVANLEQQVISAVKLGPQYEEEAKLLIGQLEEKKADLEEAKSAYESAKAASEQAKRFREDYLRQMDQKIQQAMRAISKAKQAKMQEQLSSLMLSFQTGDQSDVLERMTEKIEERAAKAQAKVELATGSVESRLRDIQREARKADVDAKLLEYKRQLGLLPPETASPERSLSPLPEQPEQNPQS